MREPGCGPGRPIHMRRAALPCLLVVVTLLPACAQRLQGGNVGTRQPSGSKVPTSSPSAEQRYEASGMVLQKKGRPAMLCLGAIALSDPPQCGDVPITNWDWDRVEGWERRVGVTWGSFRVVGTYDGTAFTLLEIAQPSQGRPREPVERFPIPCPEPESGWRASDPGRTSEDDRDAVNQLAENQPDFAGLWVKILKSTPGVDVYGPDDLVLIVAFTGDLERNRAELANVWGGPLCLVKHDRSMAELLRIQEEFSSPNDFGVQLLSSSVDVIHNDVEIRVVLFDEETRARIDARYGEGTVRLDRALTPVPED